MKKINSLALAASALIILSGCGTLKSNIPAPMTLDNSQSPTNQAPASPTNIPNPIINVETSSKVMVIKETPKLVTTPTPVVTEVAQKVNVNIQNFAFTPASLTIKKGDTVTWTNSDSAPHQIKSDTFNSSQLSTGQSYSFTFNQMGNFDYICAIHPSMKGQIIVK